MKETFEFLKNTKTYFISTIDNNKPRVRPFGTIDLLEDKLYIQTGKKKDVYKQIKQNNNVEICAFNGNEWIRIETSLIEDDRVEAKKHMLDEYPELRSIYNENDSNTIVFYLSNTTSTISSFTHEPLEYKF